MRLPLRRIGNSFGVIVPKGTLESWGVGEGGHLELDARGIHPPTRRMASHQRLDELKRTLALAVIRDFSSREIRAQGLANLHRWKKQGTWVSAYDEWQAIMEKATDGELFAAMLGRDDDSNRLRQSMPFAGLLSEEQVRAAHEEAGA